MMIFQVGWKYKKTVSTFNVGAVFVWAFIKYY